MKQGYSYEEMKDNARKFYALLGCEEIDENLLKDAIASLTMPQYAHIFNSRNKDSNINDHRALATLGDAICGSLLLTKKYRYDSTPKKLTFVKKMLTNDNLNEKGKQLLHDHLFCANNDLKKINKKAYATAFEAVIGFLSLIDINLAKTVFDKYIE